MTRVHFMSQLAAPPPDRVRTGVVYPRVAQNNTIHDRIGSKDLYLGNRPLSSIMMSEDDNEMAPVAVIESPTDSPGDESGAISPSVTAGDASPRVKLHPTLAKHLSSHMRQRLRAMSTRPPTQLPPLAAPCSSNDSSSQSSNSSGRTSPSSGFLEEHMQKREEELRNSELFEAADETEPNRGGECAVAS